MHIEVLDLPVPVDVVDGIWLCTMTTTVFQVEIEVINCPFYPARTGCEFQMSWHTVHSMTRQNFDTSVEIRLWTKMCI